MIYQYSKISNIMIRRDWIKTANPWHGCLLEKNFQYMINLLKQNFCSDLNDIFSIHIYSQV